MSNNQQDQPAANAGKGRGGTQAKPDPERDDRYAWSPDQIELTGSTDPVLALYKGKPFNQIPEDLGGSAPARTPEQKAADERRAQGKPISPSTPRNRRRAQRATRNARKGK